MYPRWAGVSAVRFPGTIVERSSRTVSLSHEKAGRSIRGERGTDDYVKNVFTYFQLDPGCFILCHTKLPIKDF